MTWKTEAGAVLYPLTPKLPHGKNSEDQEQNRVAKVSREKRQVTYNGLDLTLLKPHTAVHSCDSRMWEAEGRQSSGQD